MEILKRHLEKLIKTLSSKQKNQLKNRLADLILTNYKKTLDSSPES